MGRKNKDCFYNLSPEVLNYQSEVIPNSGNYILNFYFSRVDIIEAFVSCFLNLKYAILLCYLLILSVSLGLSFLIMLKARFES